MFDQFLALLHHRDLDLSAEQIADSLWLAMYFGEVSLRYEAEANHANSTEHPSLNPRSGLPSSDTREQPEDSSETLTSTPTATTATTTATTSGQITSVAGVVEDATQQSVDQALIEKLEAFAGTSDHKDMLPRLFRGPSAIRSPLEIARALRPFARRVPSRTRFSLDEETTIEQTAEARRLTLVVRPARERWLELAVVVEASPSMVVWDDWVNGLLKLLAGTGIFRDVRAWTMHYAPDRPEGDQAYLCVRSSRSDPLHSDIPRSYPLKTLFDPHGRMMVLVLSDCLSPAWSARVFQRALYERTQRNLVSLVQLLPRRFWQRTALKQAERSEVFATQPVSNANQLRTVKHSAIVRAPASEQAATPEPAADRLTAPMPVTMIEPVALHNWARMVSGQASLPLPALVLSDTLQPLTHLPARLTVKPLQQLAFFKVDATPLSFTLACYLALARPLSLPVMRLIQQALLPESNELHLIEILTSKLLVEWPEAPLQPQTGYYTFPEEVRDALLSDFNQAQRIELISKISTFLMRRNSLPTTFRAYLSRMEAGNTEFLKAMAPFAMVMVKLITIAWQDEVIRKPIQIEVDQEEQAVGATKQKLSDLGSSLQIPAEEDQIVSLLALLDNTPTDGIGQTPLERLNTVLYDAAETLRERADELARGAAAERKVGLNRFDPPAVQAAAKIYADIVVMLERGELLLDRELNDDKEPLLEQLTARVAAQPIVQQSRVQYQRLQEEAHDLATLLSTLLPRFEQATAQVLDSAIEQVVAELAALQQMLLPDQSARLESEAQRAAWFRQLLHAERDLREQRFEAAEKGFRALLEHSRRLSEHVRARADAGLNDLLRQRAAIGTQWERIRQLLSQVDVLRAQQRDAAYREALRLLNQILDFPIIQGADRRQYEEQHATIASEHERFLAQFAALQAARSRSDLVLQALELQQLLQASIAHGPDGEALADQLDETLAQITNSQLQQADTYDALAETAFSEALESRDSAKATVAVQQYDQAIALLDQPISADTTAAAAAVHQLLRERIDRKDAIQHYRHARRRADDFVQILTLLAEAEQSLRQQALDTAYQQFSNAAVRAATSSIGDLPLVQQLYEEALHGLGEVNTARVEASPVFTPQQELNDIVALESEIEALINAENTANYKKALNLLSRIQRSSVVLNDPERRAHYAHRRSQIEQQYDQLQTLFGMVRTARQLEDVATEMIELRMLIARGLTKGDDNESLDDRLVDLSRRFTATLLRQADEYISQARQLHEDGLRKLDVGCYDSAGELYRQVIAMLDQPELLHVHPDAEKPARKAAIGFLRQQLIERPEWQSALRLYRSDKQAHDRLQQLVSEARREYNLAQEDLLAQRVDMAINRLRTVRRRLEPHYSRAIDDALAQAEQWRLEQLLPSLEQALLAARVAVAHGRSDEAIQQIDAIEDRLSHAPEVEQIRRLASELRDLRAEMNDIQQQLGRISRQRPIHLSGYQELLEQVDQLRSRQPQSAALIREYGRIVRAAADLAPIEVRSVLSTGQLAPIRMTAQRLTALNRRLVDLPDEPAAGRRQRALEEALRSIERALLTSNSSL